LGEGRIVDFQLNINQTPITWLRVFEEGKIIKLTKDELLLQIISEKYNILIKFSNLKEKNIWLNELKKTIEDMTMSNLNKLENTNDKAYYLKKSDVIFSPLSLTPKNIFYGFEDISTETIKDSLDTMNSLTPIKKNTFNTPIEKDDSFTMNFNDLNKIDIFNTSIKKDDSLLQNDSLNSSFGNGNNSMLDDDSPSIKKDDDMFNSSFKKINSFKNEDVENIEVIPFIDDDETFYLSDNNYCFENNLFFQFDDLNNEIEKLSLYIDNELDFFQKINK
jgi:hypothetical protein